MFIPLYLSSKPTTNRAMLDIELQCSDGIYQASSVLLAFNSVVFERMFYAKQPMEECKTNRVILDDILMADVELLHQCCQV